MTTKQLSRGVSRIALGAALSLIVTGAALAQSSGALRVTITSKGGQPLAGATVIIKAPDSLVTKTAITDSAGKVRVSGLDPSTRYTVTVKSSGYKDFSADQVAVVSGKDLSVGYALANDENTVEEIVVTGRSLAAVDVTSATVSTTLTLGIVEALPTARSYQSYLQLVPGVKPGGGNPSSRSGVNYSDVGGTIGTSTDNVYYLDGVNVTDPLSGTFGTNFNSEIIQEQQVITGGAPAEYAGGSGLISLVSSKSGSNEWHGSLNYYLQNDSLVAKDRNANSGGFSTYDTAFTLGGPIIQDKVWVFGSYQKKNRKDEVLNPTTGEVRRQVENDAEYAFLKATWQITDNDRLTGAFFRDPTNISGSNSATVLNNRDSKSIQGGDNYRIDYARTWNNLQFNAYYWNHQAELSRLAADQSARNTVSFRGLGSTLEQRSLGGSGLNSKTERNSEEYGVKLEYFLDTAFGTHTLKGGYAVTNNVYKEDETIPGGATYRSISSTIPGRTYQDYTTSSSGWTDRPFVQTDIPRILAAMVASPSYNTFKALLDTDGNGTISTPEFNALTFSSTSGNPNNEINAYRSLRTVDAPYEIKSEGKTFYLQDSWTLDKLTAVVGVRAEQWSHFSSAGEKLFTFDYELAPRVSVVYDVKGDGRSKVYAFVGRYYDPIRSDMADFAGNLTGPISEEQIYVANQWLTFRTRGGPVTPDSVFGPKTKTPYTDEYMIGGSTTIGASIGVSASLTRRVTKDIFEDYDLGIYSDPTCTVATCASIGHASPGTFFYLPYSYFGFSSKPNANYVLGTLAGGKREYTGFELTITKYKTGNWQGQASYTRNWASGNSNSDGNADFQGDWIAIDPRAPNMWGPQAGNIEHQFKAYGSYDFDFGLQVSGVFNWNSGALFTPADPVIGRYFAPQDEPYLYGGVIESYTTKGKIGSEKNPSYYTLDTRLKYERDLPYGKVELFLDAFNILNKQSPTGVQKLIAGDGVYAFKQPNAWVAPRRFYLGVRYSF